MDDETVLDRLFGILIGAETDLFDRLNGVSKEQKERLLIRLSGIDLPNIKFLITLIEGSIYYQEAIDESKSATDTYCLWHLCNATLCWAQHSIKGDS